MTEQRLDRIIGTLLQVGVLLSAAVVLAGGIYWLSTSGSVAPDYAQFHSRHHAWRPVAGLLTSSSEGRPELIIELGLLLLIATPVARVVFSLFAFGVQRDWTYVAITAIVLAVLAYSLVSARSGGAGDSPALFKMFN